MSNLGIVLGSRPFRSPLWFVLNGSETGIVEILDRLRCTEYSAIVRICFVEIIISKPQSLNKYDRRSLL